MHTLKDYSKSPAPAFDAVEDIKEYLGKARWRKLYPLMAAVTDPNQFDTMCSFAGISGAPVRYWYELYHGGGSWNRAVERATGLPESEPQAEFTPQILDRLETLTRANALRQLNELAVLDDPEAARNAADSILCNLLVGLGYSDVVEAWGRVAKQYA